MKKLSVVVSAMLCCSLAYSQEVDVRIIPRVDVNACVPVTKDGGWDVDFGSTSLYTLVDGTFLENFSYSVEAHWLSVYGYEDALSGITDLYTQTLYSNANNWLDWANITYTLPTGVGSFDISAGKDVMALGTYEIDAYDFDSHFGMNSLFWNYAPIYQWGGKVGYTTLSEMTSICFQATTSPFGGMMFRERQYGAYGLKLTGDYGCYAPLWSVNFIGYDKARYMNVIALGNQFYAGDFTIGLDWTSRARTAKNFFGQEMSLMGTLGYASDRFEVFAKAGWERFGGGGFFGDADIFGLHGDYCEPMETPELTTPEASAPAAWEPLPVNYIFGGAGAYWYPLRDSQDLRVHAIVCANSWSGQMSVNIGITYNFSVFSR